MNDQITFQFYSDYTDEDGQGEIVSIEREHKGEHSLSTMSQMVTEFMRSMGFDYVAGLTFFDENGEELETYSI